MDSRNRRIVKSKPSRNGCRTCRTRRIKCDEGKPACNRCTSTGRKCDGYEAISMSNDRLVERQLLPSRVVSPRSQAHSNLCAFKNEQHGFENFLRRATRLLELRLPSAPWVQLVLQFSQELPVFRAIAALGTAHGNLVQVMHVAFIGPLQVDDEALDQYCAAIASLRKRLGGAMSRPTSLEPVLLTCILFVCFEMVRNNTDAAISHLRLGRKVANESQKSNDVVPEAGIFLKPQSCLVSNELISMFDQLEEGCVASHNPQLDSVALKESTILGLSHHLPILIDLRDVKSQLDALVIAGYELRMKLLQLADKDPLAVEHSSSAAEAFCRKQCVSRIVDLRSDRGLSQRLWQLIQSHTSCLDHIELLAHGHGTNSRLILFLQIQHFFSFFLLSACRQTREVLGGVPHERYVQILDIVERYLANTPRSHRTRDRPSPRLNFTVDPGILPSLFLISLKCRDSIVRRRAIALLSDTDRLEGFYQSRRLAACARLVIRFEELKAREISPGLGATELLTEEQVPESARFLDVVGVAATAKPQELQLVCGRFAHERKGELEIVELKGRLV